MGRPETTGRQGSEAPGTPFCSLAPSSLLTLSLWMSSRRNSGCSWPVPRPATSSSERSRGRATGRPSCSKVSAHGTLAGSGEQSPQREAPKDGAGDCFAPGHPAPLPWASGLLWAVRSLWWEAALALVTLAVVSRTVETPTAHYYHQQCQMLLQDLASTLNGTRPKREVTDMRSAIEELEKEIEKNIHNAV